MDLSDDIDPCQASIELYTREVGATVIRLLAESAEAASKAISRSPVAS